MTGGVDARAGWTLRASATCASRSATTRRARHAFGHGRRLGAALTASGLPFASHLRRPDGRGAASRTTGPSRPPSTIADPDLWWPAGLGPQTLHDLDVRVGDRTARRRIGLRTIELVTEPDAAGRSFGFRVNGRDVFAKGANWIPADALPGRITEAKTRDLLQSAVDANMNMIRVWGGGRYEPDWFYDACDELGLMVWQDFMFACNLYPSTPSSSPRSTPRSRERRAASTTTPASPSGAATTS